MVSFNTWPRDLVLEAVRDQLGYWRNQGGLRVTAINSSSLRDLPDTFQTKTEPMALELAIACPGDIACDITQVSQRTIRATMTPTTDRSEWRSLTYDNAANLTPALDVSISFNKEIIVSKAAHRNGFLEIRVEEDQNAYRKIPIEVAQIATTVPQAA